jgi:hypothetical protein
MSQYAVKSRDVCCWPVWDVTECGVVLVTVELVAVLVTVVPDRLVAVLVVSVVLCVLVV